MRTPYSYTPIVDRPVFAWPQDAKVALYVGLNVEHFRLGMPSTALNAATVGLQPDALNHGWRDYGNRVGIWRLTDVLDHHGVPASVLLNTEVIEHYPR